MGTGLETEAAPTDLPVSPAGRREIVRPTDLEWRLGVSRLEDDLHATAEDIVADAEELKQVEEEKTRLESDDPRMTELSERSERLARRMHGKTVIQRRLAEEAGDSSRKRRLD